MKKFKLSLSMYEKLNIISEKYHISCCELEPEDLDEFFITCDAINLEPKDMLFVTYAFDLIQLCSDSYETADEFRQLSSSLFRKYLLDLAEIENREICV